MSDRCNDGGLTSADREWLARQLAPAQVTTTQVRPQRAAMAPSRVDKAMAYAPAAFVSLLLSTFVGVFSISVGAPRVWPGVLVCLVLNFLSLGSATWSLERRKAARGGRRG